MFHFLIDKHDTDFYFCGKFPKITEHELDFGLFDYRISTFYYCSNLIVLLSSIVFANIIFEAKDLMINREFNKFYRNLLD